MLRRILFAGACSLVGYSAIAAPLPDAIPVEVFATLPAIESPKLSPNGQFVAAKVDIRGEQHLVITPLFGGAKRVLANGDNDLNWWRWVSDDWLVLGLGDSQKFEGDEVYVTRTTGIDAKMSKVVPLDWRNSGISADDVIWIARDGSPQILLSKQTGISTMAEWYPSVFRIDVSTGKAKQVQGSDANVWNWGADEKGIVRTGQRTVEDGTQNLLYRAAVGERYKSMPMGKSEDDAFVMPYIYRPDGTAITISNHEGRDAVYELSLPAFKIGKKLGGSDRYDIDAIISNVSDNDLDGIVVTEGNERVQWLNPVLNDLQRGLDRAVGAGNSKIISFSRDRSRMLVRIGAPNQAGGLYYWDTSNPKLNLIGWNNMALKGRKLSPVKMINYTARDGTPIEAVMILPRGRPAKNLPLIVMPHGGPSARDSASYDWWTQYLAELGYAVIQPNYRGSTGYGKAFHKLGEGQWGLKMQDDLIDAIDWAAKQGIADPKRVCIVGASYGGYAAMRGAQRDGGRYRCAVSYAGVSDLSAMKRYDSKFLSSAKKYWKKLAPDFTAVSPRFHPADFTAPILIAHGVKDKRVPVRQSRMMVEALNKAGKPVDYIEQPEGDHHFSRSADRLQFLKALGAFLSKHNPA